MSGTFSRIKNWITGESLTASDLNAEFSNILNNLDPTGIDDESANDAAAQATPDPYPGSLSKATSLKIEIKQLRYLLAQITGKTYWYIDPDVTIAALNTFLASCNLTDHAILVGGGSSPITPIAVMTNGQLLMGATGADPAPQTVGGDATLATDGALTIAANAVTEGKILAGAVTEGKLGASAVAQAKLKTSTHEQTNATESWVEKTLTYADYGFECRFKHSGSGTYDAEFARASQANSQKTKSSSYVGESVFILGHTAGAYYVTAYVIYRYITSSGEIFWLWILRDKKTKEIISVDASSDHCSFGKENPSERPHPFESEYDPAKHEIILINPTEDEMKELYAKKKKAGSDSLIETFLNEYKIDELSNPEWPTTPVTTQIINDDWFEAWINKEPVDVVKKQIPKVDYVKCKSLKAKLSKVVK